MPSGATRRCVSLDPGRLDEVIDCVGDGWCRDRHGDRRRRAHAGPACPGGGGAARRSEDESGPACSSWNGPNLRSTPATGFPIRWRRPAAVPVLAVAGARSRRLTWEEIAGAKVDVTVFMPCGFDLAGAVAQAPALLGPPGGSRSRPHRRRRRQCVLLPPRSPASSTGWSSLRHVLHGSPGSVVPGSRVLRS